MSVFPLLAILFLGFASSANALTEAGLSTTTCLYKSAKDLTINPKHAGTKVTTCSQLTCIATHCKAVKHCAVSFHPETGQCLGVSSKVLETLPELSKSGQLFKASKDGWFVIVSGHMAVNKASTAIKAMKAAAFWPLDSKNKGRNLGTKGEVLNMEVPGVDWNSKGPNGSKRKFARFSKKSRAKVQLKKNGELALNMTSFTIGAWIKRDEGVNEEFILMYDKVFSVAFNGISLSDNKISVSTSYGHAHSNSDSKFKFSPKTEYSWHHFSVVFDGDKPPISYMDGNQLKASYKRYKVHARALVPLPSKLDIGHADYMGQHFMKFLVGGISCLFISEAALKPEEIKHLKNSCP